LKAAAPRQKHFTAKDATGAKEKNKKNLIETFYILKVELIHYKFPNGVHVVSRLSKEVARDKTQMPSPQYGSTSSIYPDSCCGNTTRFVVVRFVRDVVGVLLM